MPKVTSKSLRVGLLARPVSCAKANSTNPPTLGSGGTGTMPWVADDGWTIVNTGISPNGQPDFVALSDVSAQTTSAPARAANPQVVEIDGGVAEWWWVFLLLLVGGLGAWYFLRGRTHTT